jgi:hypothetical protein
VKRCPRMHGWPPILPGSMVMRSRASIRRMYRDRDNLHVQETQARS